MMVVTGMAITLLTKKWADAYGQTMKEKAAEYILGAKGTVFKIIGTTSITLLLAPTFELDVANVAVCSGNFYQGLLRCDLLCWHNKALSTATITFYRPDQPGTVSWLYKKVGCVVVAQMELQ